MNGKKVIGIILTVFGSFFTFLAIIFGVVFVAVGGVMSSSSEEVEAEFVEFAEDAEMTTGEIIYAYDGSTTIEYEVDGEYYQVDYNVSSSEYTEGDYVSVYYETDNPYVCMVPDVQIAAMDMAGGIFSGVGIFLAVIFLFIGLAAMIPGIILIKKSKTTYDN